ncbi:MAG: TolC family outer membrane protein, partial [Rhodospirillales bacterium]|nr:TolC family outer membrane protein [Rhodospirillales bacterium]
LNLQDAFAQLVYNHPQIKAATKSLASSREVINVATAEFLPKVNVTSDYGGERIDNPSERLTGDGKISSRTKQKTTVTMTQNIFDGFASTSAAKAAHFDKLVSEAMLSTTTQTIMMEGISAYVDILRQNQLVELGSQNEETIQIQLNLEDERVQKGSGIAVDVLQAKSRLQLAKERLVRFEGALEDSFSRYIQVYNIAPEIDNMVAPMPAAELIPDNLESAIDIALTENPAVLNSDRQVAAARERRTSARSGLYPTVNLVSAWNYEVHNGGTIGTRRDYSVLLQANWDIFSGLISRATIAQAAYSYSASRDNYDSAVRKTVETVRLAWQNLKTARQRLILLENAVNIASEVFESRKKLRSAGKETVINVLDAESEVSNARINYASASFDERESVYRLMLAIGRLNIAELEQASKGAGDTLQQ